MTMEIDRSAALQRAIDDCREVDWQLVSNPDWDHDIAVMVQPERKGTNHVLHLVLSILTVGLWLPFWLLIWLTVGPTVPQRSLQITIMPNGEPFYQLIV